MSYFPAKRLLLFTYEVFSTITLKWFFRDFERATKSAALIKGISAGSEVCSLVRREPSFVAIETSKIQLNVGVRSHAFQLGIAPPHPLLSTSLFPLLEEVMEASALDAGWNLARLLEASLPIGLALQEAKFRLSDSVRVFFSTALRVRILYIMAHRQFCCVEIDARYGAKRVLIVDAFRVRASADKERDLKPVPMWEKIVKKVVTGKLGKSHRGDTMLEVPIGTMKLIIEALTSDFRRLSSHA